MTKGEGSRDSEPTRRNAIVSNEIVRIRAGELERRRRPRDAKFFVRPNE